MIGLGGLSTSEPTKMSRQRESEDRGRSLRTLSPFGEHGWSSDGRDWARGIIERIPVLSGAQLLFQSVGSPTHETERHNGADGTVTTRLDLVSDSRDKGGTKAGHPLRLDSGRENMTYLGYNTVSYVSDQAALGRLAQLQVLAHRTPNRSLYSAYSSLLAGVSPD